MSECTRQGSIIFQSKMRLSAKMGRTMQPENAAIMAISELNTCARVSQITLTRPYVNVDVGLIAHRAGSHKQRRLRSEHFCRIVLQAIYCGVFAITVMADLGFDHARRIAGVGRVIVLLRKSTVGEFIFKASQPPPGGHRVGCEHLRSTITQKGCPEESIAEWRCS
jgi:hypothetical protein